MTNAEIDMAEAGLLDLVQIGTVLYPPSLASAPFVAGIIKFGFTALRTGLAAGTIIPDGRGGLVTKAWADDPRHALNPDGSFKF